MVSASTTCPCGSGQTFNACCGMFHAGEPPPTALSLMRARYSAFAAAQVDFLLATGPETDRQALEAHCARVRFCGLQILNAEAGGPNDSEGFVRFTARFIEAGRFAELRERSRFLRVDGRWRYVGGDAEVVALDLGRNDPCPCGSGLKAKKCHVA